jgi:DNA repair exonuclease SbcCD nuclease subunit
MSKKKTYKHSKNTNTKKDAAVIAKDTNSLVDYLAFLPGLLMCVMLILVLILDFAMPGMAEKQYEDFPNIFTVMDYVIIAGDFGAVWDGDRSDKYLQKNYNERNFTTLFVDGNHENFDLLNSYPVEMWNGGKIHRISDSIIHLMRGQVFTIGDKTFFTMGGALSIDKIYRTEGLSWWREEIPSYKEMNEAFDNLLMYNNKVDYVLTHTCISELTSLLVNCGSIYPDTTTKMLDSIHSKIEFDKWYFAHWHMEKDFGKYECLYNNIVKLL